MNKRAAGVVEESLGSRHVHVVRDELVEVVRGVVVDEPTAVVQDMVPRRIVPVPAVRSRDDRVRHLAAAVVRERVRVARDWTAQVVVRIPKRICRYRRKVCHGVYLIPEVKVAAIYLARECRAVRKRQCVSRVLEVAGVCERDARLRIGNRRDGSVRRIVEDDVFDSVARGGCDASVRVDRTRDFERVRANWRRLTGNNHYCLWKCHI